MSVVFSFVPRSTSVRREDLLSGLGLDDDGSPTWEIGRAETGATCLVVDDDGGLRVHLPLLRSPTSARDLLPTLLHAADAAGYAFDPPDPLAVWDRLHEEACRSLDPGAPLPPHLPRAALDHLHTWLIAIAETPMAAGPLLALDPPTRVVVGLPDHSRVLLPPFDVLANVDGVTRVFPLTRFGPARADGFVEVDVDALGALTGGELLGDVRVVTPVEIVDDESLL